MSSIDETIEYNLCPECSGTGKIDKKVCPHCGGRGVELLLERDSYYWGKKMTPLHIYQRSVHVFINKTINFCLFLVSLLGFASLGYYIFLVGDSKRIIEEVVFAVRYQGGEVSNIHYLLLIFWIGILIFMHLIYRMQRESEKGLNVKKSTAYSEDIGENENKVLNKKNIKRIDVSPAFTHNAIKAIERMYELMRKKDKNSKPPLDLLVALMGDDKIAMIFFRLAIDYNKFKVIAAEKMSKCHDYSRVEYFFKKIFIDAYLEAYSAKSKKVDVEDILISLIKNDSLFPSDCKDGIISEIFYELEIDFNKIENVVEWIRINEKMRKNWNKYRRRSSFKPKGTMNRAMTAIATPLLDQYSQDLTILAKFGYLSPCIGREKEIESIFRVVGSGRRGVVLTGNPGVGKDTIVEGLAQMMVVEDVPAGWKDKRLVSLSIARLISGTDSQHAMERLLQAVNEVVISRNIILVIAGIESMTGVSAGREGSLDLSEVLTSAMNKYNLTVIATTTPMDYTKYIEQSPLANVFQKIVVDEPEDNEVIRILEGKSGAVEAKNEIYFSYGAIEEVLSLTKRFISDRFLPEKAINIIKEVGLYVRKKKGKGHVVVANDVAELVSQHIKIPLSKITENESEKLLNLEDKIHERVVNQVEAVNAIADALRRSRVEFRDIKRPIANLMFLGPTGVGKTELAKTVAEVYFGSEDDMIRIDMSEYQNKDSINRLIGAPGNYEISGILTEQVRKHPFALLLLDEIEKAHPDILNLFLQVMDDGRLTDNRGRVIDFTNLIIIATSNAGTGFIQEELKKDRDISSIKQDLMNRELKVFFKPEFLNRFDGIIVFKPLTRENVRDIAKLLLKSSAKMMDDKGIKLELEESAIDWIATIGYDPLFGARPLRRAIQEKIDNLLAKYLLGGKVERGDRVVIRDDGIAEVIK